MVDIDKLEALEKAATPGPWEVAHGGSYHKGEMVSEEWFVRRPDDDVAIAADIIDPYDSKPSKANADFITESRNAFPELVREVRELRGIAEAARELAGYLSGHTNTGYVDRCGESNLRDALARYDAGGTK